MTSFCANSTRHPLAGIALPHNMVATLSQIELEGFIHNAIGGGGGGGDRDPRRTTMDTKREHMAGGQMITIQKALGADENHNHCDHRPDTIVLIVPSCDCHRSASSPKKDRRHSTTCRPDREAPDGRGAGGAGAPMRAPRSPLHEEPEPRSRPERTSLPSRNGSSSGELQKYENVPMPGIIPRCRKASSPTPPTIVSGATEPISFYSRVSCLSQDRAKATILVAEQRLKASGFYYENTSVQDAKRMLHSAEVGTFLVRMSSQKSHFFALSIKTNRGTTSIRIAYDFPRFRLDADPNSVARMPSFDCVIALIEYYVVQSASDARNKCVFLESNGRRDTPVILTRPYRDRPQSLRHLCRRTIHYHLSGSALERYLDKHSASIQVRQYLQSYPYAL